MNGKLAGGGDSRRGGSWVRHAARIGWGSDADGQTPVAGGGAGLFLLRRKLIGVGEADRKDVVADAEFVAVPQEVTRRLHEGGVVHVGRQALADLLAVDVGAVHAAEVLHPGAVVVQ